jgi:hypothetical protein
MTELGIVIFMLSFIIGALTVNAVIDKLKISLLMDKIEECSKLLEKMDLK